MTKEIIVDAMKAKREEERAKMLRYEEASSVARCAQSRIHLLDWIIEFAESQDESDAT